MSSVNELLKRAGEPDAAITRLLAAAVLERAGAEAHWTAIETLDCAKLQALRESERASRLERKQWEKERNRSHRRAVEAANGVARALASGATFRVRCKGDKLFIKPGNREFAFRFEE